jgi:endonuclease III
VSSYHQYLATKPPKRLNRIREKAQTIHRLLDRAYHVPDLGNLSDPVEELVFISLSRQTHQANVRRTWEALVHIGGVEGIREVSFARLQRLLKSGGFSRQKARWIKQALALVVNRFGELSLDKAREMSDENLEGFLCSLPGIGIKSAKCIMMYSMGRKVLPIDTHVRRLATRVGLVPAGLSERRIHQALERIVRANDRHAFHVNAICHGRAICTARSPHCEECLILKYCKFGRKATPASSLTRERDDSWPLPPRKL